MSATLAHVKKPFALCGGEILQRLKDGYGIHDLQENYTLDSFENETNSSGETTQRSLVFDETVQLVESHRFIEALDFCATAVDDFLFKSYLPQPLIRPSLSYWERLSWYQLLADDFKSCFATKWKALL